MRSLRRARDKDRTNRRSQRPTTWMKVWISVQNSHLTTTSLESKLGKVPMPLYEWGYISRLTRRLPWKFTKSTSSWTLIGESRWSERSNLWKRWGTNKSLDFTRSLTPVNMWSWSWSTFQAAQFTAISRVIWAGGYLRPRQSASSNRWWKESAIVTIDVLLIVTSN